MWKLKIFYAFTLAIPNKDKLFASPVTDVTETPVDVSGKIKILLTQRLSFLNVTLLKQGQVALLN